jgi:hypothetical protein
MTWRNSLRAVVWFGVICWLGLMGSMPGAFRSR